MENVTIQSVTAKKTGAKNGKPWTISEVVLMDGRKVDTFDQFNEGESYDVVITPNGQYSPNMKRAKSAGQSQAATFKNAEVANKAIDANNTKDLRITMLSCISSAANLYAQRGVDLHGSPLTVDTVCATAKKFYALAMEQVDELPFIIVIPLLISILI